LALSMTGLGAGCSSTGGTSGSGGSGSGGRGSGGTPTTGAGGAVQGSGGAGSGGSGAGGRADAGAPDAPTTDATLDTRGADTGAGDTRPADAAGGDARDGGGDATAAFAPCPADGGACIVMPLGDSITEGYPDFVGGYRVELFHQANLGGKNITFVGRRPNGPASGMVDGKPFPTGSEGYSGYTIAAAPGFTGITTLTVPAINMFHPHVILLAIGTNDVNNNVDLANAPTRLGALIDMITTAAPSTLLVVAQIIPTRTDTTNTRIQAYNSAIPALVQTRANAGKHVLRVDMYTTYTARADYKTALLVDDLHPNPAGYALMGQTWYGVIAPYLR
jgi:lysophospholipase L1-like esterase